MAPLSLLPYLVVAWLLLVGLYGIVTSRNLVHLIGCLGVVQSAVYVVLLCLGYRHGGSPPVSSGGASASSVDPVVQALTLTGIVVGAVVTALLLCLAIQGEKRFGTLDPQDFRTLEG